jgi:hypothetical protein
LFVCGLVSFLAEGFGCNLSWFTVEVLTFKMIEF